MVVTVSTVKDTLANVQFFVQANLANGVDHMVIFLDSPQPEVLGWLDGHPSVTAVKSEDWWGADRPKNLNRRQRINANATKEALSHVAGVDWLFHIDADEVALLDREALAAVPESVPAVRLLPHEAISTPAASERPTRFKRLLDEGELSLLRSLGLLSEPTNSLYFRSHVIGKVGIRPQAPDLSMRHHNIVDGEGTQVTHHRDSRLGLLHYESWSGVEFVRKWTSMIGSGPSINFGQHRAVIADGIRSLLGKDLPADVTGRYLEALYHRHMADPVEQLQELGLLLEAEPTGGQHQPRALTGQRLAALHDALADLGGTDKDRFAPQPSPAPAPPTRRRGVFRRAEGRSRP